MNKLVKAALAAVLAITCIASAACAEFDADKDIDVISREDGSGTRGAFIELTGVEQKVDGVKMDMTTEDAQITNSTAVMLSTVAGDTYAIGYVSLGSLNDSVKAVQVEGVTATAENVANGSYVLACPFNIAYKEEALSELGRDFVAFVMSAEGQAIIDANGYVGSADAPAYAGTAPEQPARRPRAGDDGDALRHSLDRLRPVRHADVQQRAASGLYDALRRADAGDHGAPAHHAHR